VAIRIQRRVAGAFQGQSLEEWSNPIPPYLHPLSAIRDPLAGFPDFVE